MGYYEDTGQHPFDINGMSTGDIFFGCKKCSYQSITNACVVLQCPVCLGTLVEYKVTYSDKQCGIDHG